MTEALPEVFGLAVCAWKEGDLGVHVYTCLIDRVRPILACISCLEEGDKLGRASHAFTFFPRGSVW